MKYSTYSAYKDYISNGLKVSLCLTRQGERQLSQDIQSQSARRSSEIDSMLWEMDWVIEGGPETCKLKPYERFILYLLYTGKTKNEIAIHLNTSVPTLRKMLRKIE